MGPMGPVAAMWNEIVNESGSSLANWTQTMGAWSVASGDLQFTSGQGATGLLRFTAPVAQSALVLEADINISSSGPSPGTLYMGASYVGLLFNWDGNVNNGPGYGAGAFLYTQKRSLPTDGAVYTEQPNFQVQGPFSAFPFNFDTFYTLRVVAIGNVMDIYVNGMYQETAYRTIYDPGTTPNVLPRYIGIRVTNCVADLRNIHLYTMALP